MRKLAALAPTVVALSLALRAVAGLAAEPTELVDTVGTLALSEELDARGNLGGVAVDRLGFLYVANFRDALWRISPEGEVETLSRAFYGSSGIAVDPRGDVYQASFFGNTVTRLRRTGEVDRFVESGLAGPVGLAFDPEDGSLYVCNCNGNSIARVSPAGAVETLAESELFGCPNGIAVGPDKALYVTNFNHHDLLKVTRTGEVSRFANVPGGAGNAHLAFSRGFFYVTKIIANRVVKVSLEGEVFPVAGSGAPGHDDGRGPEAAFFHPNGIAVSPAGDRLYVNTMIGEYGQPTPSTLTVRTIDLLTLSSMLEAALEAGGVEALASAYERWAADPVRGRENTIGELIALGYKHLSSRRVPEALELFRLNAAAHPEAAAAQYHLGEAFRYTGQTDRAVEQYRKTLALDAGHALAASRLEQLGAAG